MIVFVLCMVLLPFALLIGGFIYSSIYPTNEDVKVLNRCLKDVSQVDEVSKVKKELNTEVKKLKLFISKEFDKYDPITFKFKG